MFIYQEKQGSLQLILQITPQKGRKEKAKLALTFSVQGQKIYKDPLLPSLFVKTCVYFPIKYKSNNHRDLTMLNQFQGSLKEKKSGSSLRVTAFYIYTGLLLFSVFDSFNYHI